MQLLLLSAHLTRFPVLGTIVVKKMWIHDFQFFPINHFSTNSNPTETCVSEVELVGQSMLHAVLSASLSQELQSSQ